MARRGRRAGGRSRRAVRGGAWWGGVVAGLVLAGCGGGEATSAGTGPRQAAAAASGGSTITAAARAEAKTIFQTRCAVCHGEQGRGDGPGSAGLDPKPRNFQDADWQASVTDEHIEKIIVYGGAAVGRSPTMPGNPDLQGKPAVVAALREYIRNLER
ncbi:MAG: hypothetical protein KatS3mg102_2641 [Planctomycetota bacterium]|nr:MAG: hypothetical protein KatS3mg102_2641 [Planctomycetota bacterium]